MVLAPVLHIVEHLAGIADDFVAVVFADASLSAGTVALGVAVRTVAVALVLVAVGAVPGEVFAEADIKVEAAHDVVVLVVYTVAVGQAVEVVGLCGVHPSLVAVGSQASVLKIGAVPGEHGVHGVDAVLGIAGIAHHADDGGFQRQPLAGLELHAGIHAVLLVFVTLHGTFFIEISHGEESVHLFRTALERYVVVLRIAHMGGKVPPVEIAVAEVGVPAGEADLVGILHRGIVVVELAAGHHLLVTIVEDVHTCLGRNVHTDVAALAALGGDDDDTVCTLRTVDGSGSGILEDTHAGDVGRIEEVGAVADDDSVNHPQRSGGSGECGGTADSNGRGGTRLAASLCHVHTADLAVEHGADVAGGHIGKVGGFQHLHGTGEAFLLLYAVTHHHGLFKGVGAFLEGDGHVTAVPGHRLCLVADIADVEGGTLLHTLNGERTGKVGNRTEGGTLHNDAGTYKGLAGFVDDDAAALLGLLHSIEAVFDRG